LFAPPILDHCLYCPFPINIKMLARAINKVVIRPSSLRAFAASPWGNESWRYDKNAFKNWCADSVAHQGKARREMYGFLSIAFGDVDADKDGFINVKEFDLLLEKVAALPRRFGMAPSWVEEYGGDVEKRKTARAKMFDALDTRNGPARGVIGMKQFLRWANAHVVEKVATIDMKKKVDFYHVEQHDEQAFVAHLDEAVNNTSSPAFASFYEFLLTIFVESDVECKGTIKREELDVLLDRAAAVPRYYGLAPKEYTKEGRDAIFKQMDTNGEGYVTFRKFVSWTVAHTRSVLKKQKEGKGYKHYKQ